MYFILSKYGHSMVMHLMFCQDKDVSLSHWYPGSGVVLDCIDS